MSRRLRSLANRMDESDNSDNSDSEEDAALEFETHGDDESSSEEAESGIDDDEEGFKENDNDDNYLIPSDNDSDNDAPDDIGFDVTKDLALKNIKDAINVLKNEKVSKKNKRKLKDEMFQIQKKKKLEELEKNKLPNDILEAVSGKKLNPVKTIETEKNNSRIRFEEEDDDLDEAVIEESEEFIPLNSSKGLVVKSVKSTKKKPSNSAKDFRENMLYGSRLKRVDAQTVARQKAKRRARYL